MRYGIQINRLRKLVVAASLVATTLLTVAFPLTALAATSGPISFVGVYYPGRRCTKWVKPAPNHTMVNAYGTASLPGEFVVEEGRWGKNGPLVTTGYKNTVSPVKPTGYRLCYQNVIKDTRQLASGSIYIETK